MIQQVQFLKRPYGVQFGTPPFRAWYYSWLTDTPSGCQEWRGYRYPNGYGYLGVGKKSMLAHRVAYELANGPIPDNQVIRHTCHNRACCRVSHLATGSQADNMRDRVVSGRHIDAPDLSQTNSIQIRERREPNMKFGSADFVGYFWNQSERVGECLEWQRAKDSNGYGVLRIGESQYRAHRIAWQLWMGDIPKGMVVIHKCDNRVCLDIHHLRLGTQADNMADMVAKGRQPKGESHCRAKLTEEDVRDIRRRYATGNYLQREIAKAFGVNQDTVCKIVNRKTWRHVK